MPAWSQAISGWLGTSSCFGDGFAGVRALVRRSLLQPLLRWVLDPGIRVGDVQQGGGLERRRRTDRVAGARRGRSAPWWPASSGAWCGGVVGAVVGDVVAPNGEAVLVGPAALGLLFSRGAARFLFGRVGGACSFALPLVGVEGGGVDTAGVDGDVGRRGPGGRASGSGSSGCSAR